MLEHFFDIITAPIRSFWEKAQAYRQEGNYLPIIGAFLLSLGLVALMAFVAFVIIIWLFNYLSNHIGIVVVIGLIAWLYWAVLNKSPSIHQQNCPSSPTAEEALLIESAEAECDEMQIAALKVFQDIAPEINAKIPDNIGDIVSEVGKRYTIKNGFIVYRYYLEKDKQKPKLSDDEITTTMKFIQHAYDLHIKNRKITGLTLVPYKDDNLSLPPLKVHNFEDWGHGYLIEVVHTDAAYANFHYEAWHAQHSLTNRSYNTNDSNLL